MFRFSNDSFDIVHIRRMIYAVSFPYLILTDLLYSFPTTKRFYVKPTDYYGPVG